jgi:6-phospho-beta-glucosidase
VKITVIGGGGVRSLFLASSLARRTGALGIKNIVFMDNDAEKLRIFGELALRVGRREAPDVNFSLETDPEKSLKDADYVITTIRAGGDSARVQDERIALSCGVIGQETTGAAGFSFAMRTIPALAYYCGIIKKQAKETVKVFNFTNPAGLVSQALRDLGFHFTYGICDAPSGAMRQFAAVFGERAEALSAEVYGLNHLSFYDNIKVNGKNVMEQIMEDDRFYKETDLRFFDKGLIRHLGCIPNEYLYYYFYPESALEHMLRADKTRGEVIEGINKNMMRELSEKNIKDGDERTLDDCLAIYEKWFEKRETMYMASETGVPRNGTWKLNLNTEGGYAGVALHYIETARGNSRNNGMVLCVPNGNAIPGLEPDDIIEASCDIVSGEAVPHTFGSIPPARLEFIRRVKAYERLASKAIIGSDRALAVDALALHPLVNSYGIARRMVPQYFELNAPYGFEYAGGGTGRR